jgi:hypothetical protein
MSWLHILFNSLNDTELAAVESIRLIGREREVFTYLLSFRNKELPDTEERYKVLDLTSTHYYKINSILIQKCFNKLVPAGGMALLEFMKRKNLFTLLKHEISTNEKTLVQHLSLKEKEKFYLECFRMLIDLPFKFYDAEIVDQFGEKYLESKTTLSESDKYYVRFHKLFADANRFAARKNPAKAFKLTVKDLQKYEQELTGTTHYVALYYLYRTFCSYYTFYENLPEKQLEYLNKAISLKDKIAYFFPINIGQFLNLMYADALFNNLEPLEAFKIYDNVFNEGIDQSMYGYFYHCENYALLAMVNNEYDKAQAVLDKNFANIIEYDKDIYATRGALAYAKLYLSKGDFKLALKYINAAKQINEKAFYVPFDMQIRMLENIYFFLKGDFDFALQLANRNLKFLMAQVRKSTLAKEYIAFWKAISSMLHAMARGTTVPKNTIKEFNKLQKSFRYLYADLLTIILKQVPRR